MQPLTESSLKDMVTKYPLPHPTQQYSVYSEVHYSFSFKTGAINAFIQELLNLENF